MLRIPTLRILLRFGQNLLDHEWLRKTNAPALEDLAVKHSMFCYLDWITRCCKSWRRIQTLVGKPVLSSICSGDLNFSISISRLILQLRNELCLVIVYGRIAWRPQRASVTIVEEDWCLLTEFDLNHLADKSESPNSQRLLTKSAASSKFTMESSFLWDTWTSECHIHHNPLLNLKILNYNTSPPKVWQLLQKPPGLIHFSPNLCLLSLPSALYLQNHRSSAINSLWGQNLQWP